MGNGAAPWALGSTAGVLGLMLRFRVHGTLIGLLKRSEAGTPGRGSAPVAPGGVPGRLPANVHHEGLHVRVWSTMRRDESGGVRQGGNRARTGGGVLASRGASGGTSAGAGQVGDDGAKGEGSLPQAQLVVHRALCHA